MPDSLLITSEMRSTDPCKAAFAYIDAGLSIIVTHGIDEKLNCTCGKRSCSSPGKHPIAEFFPKGVKSATRSKNKVRGALERNPDANIAACLAGRTVVDIDGPEGESTVQALTLPSTAIVLTGRGRHQHFDGELKCGSFKANQLDVLTGASRYTMLPPSIHESGVPYRWEKDASRRTAKTPVELESLNRATKRNVDFSTRKIQEGERNDRLFKVACGLRIRGIPEKTILEATLVINQRDCTPPLSETEVRKLVASSGRYDAADKLFGPPLQTTPLPMEFLWYPYIPRHAVTIVAGDPGRGKSLLNAMIIGVVTAGRPWPLSEDVPNGSRVLLLSAEDNWARVTLHRLLKAGAKVENIHVMHKFRTLSDERLVKLADYVRDWSPDLVVIDTLAAYLGGARDMHRQNEVGEFLAILNEIAEETGCAILASAHLNKQTSEHPLFRIVGSIGFAATIRSACFLGTDPSDRSRLALAHGKYNNSEIGETIIFEKVGGGKDEVPILRAVARSEATAADVCRIERAGVGRPSSEADAARDFVLESLDWKKPVEWAKLVSSANRRNIASAGTLSMVRTKLAKAGEIKQIGKARRARWIKCRVEADDE